MDNLRVYFCHIWLLIYHPFHFFLLIAGDWEDSRQQWFAFRINLISAFLDYSRTHVPTNILGTFTTSHREKCIYVHIWYL